MLELYGQCHGSTVLLHGGAGGQDPKSSDSLSKATKALNEFGNEAIQALKTNIDPMDVLIQALKRMEDDPQFNAGRGSALQEDGQTRLTAAIMDSTKQTFSGVISCSYVRNPSLIARHLQTHNSRVLTNPGAEMIARELGLPVDSNLTPDRIEKWAEKSRAGSCDTVGCVIRTNSGRIIVGTSTGGRGYEFPGRVSDSATVAGTYGSRFAGISATGVGEEIVDDAVAARIETRRRDGRTLEKACQLTFSEAVALKRMYGWIAVDGEGHWGVVYTTQAMSYTVFDETSGFVACSAGK